MNGDGAYPDEMGRLPHISDEDVDRVLSGMTPEGDDELRELTAFIHDVETVHARPPAEETAASHLAAMVEASGRREAREPVCGRKKRMFAPNQWRSRAKVAALSAAFVLAMSGLAVAGVLPDPVQSTFAGAADGVGISIEDPDEGEGNLNDVDDGAVNDVDDGTVGDVNHGVPGEEPTAPLPPADEGEQGQSGEADQSGELGQSGESGQSGELGQSGESGQSGELGQSGDSDAPIEPPAASGQSDSGGGDSGQSGGDSGQSGQSGN